MSFVTSQIYKTAATTEQLPSIALVTGAKTGGIGLAIARKIATFPFIERVVAVSRSITHADTDPVDDKLVPLAADVTTESGRQVIVDKVAELCGGGGPEGNTKKKQLRFLVHAAGTIHPITSALKLKPTELRQAILVNCEGPFFLTTALHPFLQPINNNIHNNSLSGRVLHVSSGAAHGAPPLGWAAYGITKAAFFQSFRVLEHELRGTGVVVGSFKPGVVDTNMQGVIRDAPGSDMPLVQKFIGLKERRVPLLLPLRLLPLPDP